MVSFISAKDAKSIWGKSHRGFFADQKTAAKKNKYNAKKRSLDGITFDSMREATRYLQLKRRQDSGEISELKCHPRYQLVWGKVKICSYRPDFTYILKKKLVVEDVKSPATNTYDFRLKKKMMKAAYGLDVLVIY